MKAKRGSISLFAVVAVVLGVAIMTLAVLFVQQRFSTTPSAVVLEQTPTSDSNYIQGRFPGQREMSHDAPVENQSGSVEVLPQGGLVGVTFNTSGTPISAVALRLVANQTLQIIPSQIQINPELLSGGDWICPIRTSEVVAGKTLVDIACVNVSTTGFQGGGDVLFATFPGSASFSVEREISAITRKVDGKNILKSQEANLNVN